MAMSEQFRQAVSEDFFSLIEDAILAGGFDALVLERAEIIAPCATRRPFVRRRSRYGRHWQN